jgi:mycothiol synthase
LVGCAVITHAIDEATALHVAVDPGHRGSPVGSIRDVTIRDVLLRTALARPEVRRPVRLWLMQATEADDEEVAALGFEPERDLVQMRIGLPLPRQTAATARPVATRPFRPGHDDATWLRINNLAFADHPEQGGWTLEDLHDRMRADWFDPEGFLVADNPGRDGMIGSCWTKVHRRSDPVLGEIYVISVDPSRQGEGWGKALTVAGLEWMADQGIPAGMLYTTASNTTAMKLYATLGFTIDHVDRSYVLE